MTCKCVPNFKRCPEHALEYVINTMSSKGWCTMSGDIKEASKTEEALRSLGIETLEWQGKELGQKKAKWGPSWAVLIAQCSLPWEIRKTFILHTKKNKAKMSGFVEAVLAAERLGGQEAVNAVVEDFASQVGIMMLRVMGPE